MTMLGRLHAVLFAPAPALRLATVRALVGAYCCVYLVVRAPVLADFRNFDPARFEPIGLCSWLPQPLPGLVTLGLFALCLGLAVAFTVGFRFRICGPAFGLLFMWVTSYRNSWAMVFHNENLVALHALYLGFLPAAAETLSGRSQRAPPQDAGHFGFPLKVLSAITVVTYMLAGIAKLKVSGGAWMEGNILRNYIAYDAVRKIQVGSVYSPLGAWLVQFGWPFPIIGWATMVIELGAPAALMGRRLAALWTISALAFHWGVLAIMAIAFPYPLSGVAFASLLPAERLWRLKPLSRLLTLL